MTKQEKYQLAKWTLQQALKKGAQQASVSISNSRSSSVEVRENKIDQLEQAIQRSLAIRLFIDNKYSSHSTNRLTKEEIGPFIEEAINGTRYLTEDEHRTLPAPGLYYKGKMNILQTLDSAFEQHDPQEKIDLAFQIEREVLGKDNRILSVSSNYYDSLIETLMVDSNGFEGDTSNSRYGINAQVSVKGENARPEAFWSESAIFYNELNKKGIGKKALSRAIQKIGQKKILSVKMPMIVENRQIGRIFGPLVSALSGYALQQKNSFLTGKINQKIFSEKLTITDNPFLISAPGSRLFDREGMATRNRQVVENGVLKTYYLDTYYAKKMRMKPTNGNPTNLVFKIGEKDLKGLVATVGKGILVTGFNGGNCNGSTGDFSYGIEGFLIKNGKKTLPVSEMIITGNMKSLWSGIEEVGNDVNTNTSWRTPSILFYGVDFSGR